MRLSDFKVGQTVYLKTISHRCDCFEKEQIVEAVVEKVGRRYITVKTQDFQRLCKFDAEKDFREQTDYSPEYELFLDKQTIFNYWQRSYLQQSIQNTMKQNGYDVDLDTLKQAATILGIPLAPHKGK